MYYVKCIEDYDDGTCNVTLYGKRFSFYSNMVKIKDKDKLNKEMKSLISSNGFSELNKANAMANLLKKDLQFCEITVEELLYEKGKLY